MDINIETIDFDQLDVYFIKGNLLLNPLPLRNIHQKAFHCWHETWEDYFHGEHHINNVLYSNEFTRQDNVLALFYKDECFAITFFKEVIWDDVTAPLDAYFSVWTPEALKLLRQKGDNILICSQFTVAKKFRSRKTNIPWKSILFNLSIKCFLESTSDVMTGTMRVSKGMGKMSVLAGGDLLAENVFCTDHENEFVDLIGFFPEGVGKVYEQNPYKEQLNAAWDRRNANGYKTQLRLVA